MAYHKQIKCYGCSISIQAMPEDASFEETLCDRCLRQHENVDFTQKYWVHHYADEKARQVDADTIIGWATDEGAPDNVSIADAIAILNDVGDVTIVPVPLDPAPPESYY